MSKLSDAWNTLHLYGVDPRSPKSRAQARRDAEAFLEDENEREEARYVLAALDVVDARANQD